ncbi:hypothetical protein PLICRDRAFT_523753 [Plicaturopsis crispa FD-325 SS-3]|nr:hypothetical protein PLICRDRAFT_523753 [Plicaturopsis crispa FD-325 SS-3]
MPSNAKRRRTDSDTGEHRDAPISTLPTRWEPWIDDGNIVLQAENKQFRVHRSLLRSSSHVFSDMFEVCGPAAAHQGSDEETTVDGCPVIHMADASQDWHYVLTALYDRGFYADAAVDIPFEVLAAFLRLGKKYGIRRLHAEAMSELSAQFPTTLAAYDGPKCIGPDLHRYSQFDAVHNTAVAAINLARETNTPSLLPAALYKYCSYAFEERVITGYHKRNQSLPTISTTDRDICISAHAALMRAQRLHVYPWAKPGMTSACGDPECSAWKATFLDVTNAHCLPLDRFEDWSKLGFCADCAEPTRKVYATGRQKIWDALPSFFDLPDWGTLIEADRVDTAS